MFSSPLTDGPARGFRQVKQAPPPIPLRAASRGGGGGGGSDATMSLISPRAPVDETLPDVVATAMDAVVRRALYMEGVLRNSQLGTAESDALCAEWRRGNEPDLAPLEPLVIAAALRKYLTELRFLSVAQYEAFLSAGRLDGPEARLDVVVPIVRGNPLLVAVFDFLSRVYVERASNKMSAANLALLFAPSFLHAELETQTTLLVNTKSMTSVVELLIRHVACCQLTFEDGWRWVHGEGDADDDTASTSLADQQQQQDTSSSVSPPSSALESAVDSDDPFHDEEELSLSARLALKQGSKPSPVKGLNLAREREHSLEAPLQQAPVSPNARSMHVGAIPSAAGAVDKSGKPAPAAPAPLPKKRPPQAAPKAPGEWVVLWVRARSTFRLQHPRRADGARNRAPATRAPATPAPAMQQPRRRCQRSRCHPLPVPPPPSPQPAHASAPARLRRRSSSSSRLTRTHPACRRRAARLSRAPSLCWSSMKTTGSDWGFYCLLPSSRASCENKSRASSSLPCSSSSSAKPLRAAALLASSASARR